MYLKDCHNSQPLKQSVRQSVSKPANKHSVNRASNRLVTQSQMTIQKAPRYELKLDYGESWLSTVQCRVDVRITGWFCKTELQLQIPCSIWTAGCQ
jgi:hypothetical protein